jgi:hypothetical protein
MSNNTLYIDIAIAAGTPQFDEDKAARPKESINFARTRWEWTEHTEADQT